MTAEGSGRLSDADDAATASEIVTLAAPEPPYSVIWSNDGGGWITSPAPFNPFPLPLVPAPTSTLIAQSARYFSFVQPTPSAAWTITHDLGQNPAVSVFDDNAKPIAGGGVTPRPTRKAHDASFASLAASTS